ncbi:hypothetical protein [Methyloglobulus morosus]|uniref:hypothetical protein n=1 Tax=Methyloglobulus morosus TaxID=1410681 RepID=UPI00128EC999|nr:hypothetical protein [Methyloglobulus morosus]
MNEIDISSPLPLWDDRQGRWKYGSRYGTCAARVRVRGINKVSLPRGCLNAGSRTHGRDTFLCAENHMDVANAENAGAVFRQRKVSKRNPPDAACFLRFSHLPGVVKRDSLSL